MAARAEHARGLAVTFPDKPISLPILHTAREINALLDHTYFIQLLLG